MSGHTIRTNGTTISPEEQEKRLGRVYALLIDLARREEAAAEVKPADAPPTAN